MTTILYFFWDGFSGASQGATLLGTWHAPISVHGNADRISVHGNQDRVVVHGNQERVEV